MGCRGVYEAALALVTAVWRDVRVGARLGVYGWVRDAGSFLVVGGVSRASVCSASRVIVSRLSLLVVRGGGAVGVGRG